MKFQSVRLRIIFIFLIFFFAASQNFAYYVQFKEQYWKLFHIHYNQYPDDVIENIYWLEKAQKADFANPLFALTKIENPTQWKRYRALLNMDIQLKLIQQHLVLGSKFDKRVAYFYNAPWKRENLESLKLAETSYLAAQTYWPLAQQYAEEAMKMPFVRFGDNGADYMIDEAYRIANKELDYSDIIADELKRLRKVRADFEAMDAKTY